MCRCVCVAWGQLGRRDEDGVNSMKRTVQQRMKRGSTTNTSVLRERVGPSRRGLLLSLCRSVDGPCALSLSLHNYSSYSSRFSCPLLLCLALPIAPLAQSTCIPSCSNLSLFPPAPAQSPKPTSPRNPRKRVLCPDASSPISLPTRHIQARRLTQTTLLE
jgi:hypothetical protein